MNPDTRYIDAIRVYDALAPLLALGLPPYRDLPPDGLIEFARAVISRSNLWEKAPATWQYNGQPYVKSDVLAELAGALLQCAPTKEIPCKSS